MTNLDSTINTVKVELHKLGRMIDTLPDNGVFRIDLQMSIDKVHRALAKMIDQVRAQERKLQTLKKN